MSVESSAIVWRHSQAPTQTAKLIMLKIADHDGDGGAWPSMDTLAEAGMCTKRNAQKAIRLLEDLGEIRVHLNAGGGIRTAAHMRTNVYEVLIECPWYCDRSPQHRDLRDEQHQHYRPAYWAELVAANDPLSPATPPVASDTPPLSPATPEPPNNQTTTKTSSKNDKYSTARETESDIQEPQEDYSNWHPGEAVKRAAETINAGGVISDAERDRYRQLVHGPPQRPRQPEARRTVAEDLDVQAARTLDCPEGFGNGTNRLHWFPGQLTGCARCGSSAADIVTQAATETEP